MSGVADAEGHVETVWVTVVSLGNKAATTAKTGTGEEPADDALELSDGGGVRMDERLGEGLGELKEETAEELGVGLGTDEQELT